MPATPHQVFPNDSALLDSDPEFGSWKRKAACTHLCLYLNPLEEGKNEEMISAGAPDRVSFAQMAAQISHSKITFHIQKEPLSSQFGKYTHRFPHWILTVHTSISGVLTSAAIKKPL